MMLSRMHKISSQNDQRITNPLVKSRIENLHETEASKMRNIYSVDQEIYLPGLAARYVGEIYDGKPNGYGKLYFDNDDYL